MSAIVYVAVNVYSSAEAEAGTRTGDAAVVSDTPSSSGSAVKFGESIVACETIGQGGYALPNLERYANACNTGPRYACTSTYTATLL